jgi:hypothetical protein
MTEDLLKRLVDAREWMSVRRQRESWGSPAEVVVLDPEEWDALDVAITALAEFGSARAGDDEARRRERILREALNADDSGDFDALVVCVRAVDAARADLDAENTRLRTRTRELEQHIDKMHERIEFLSSLQGEDDEAGIKVCARGPRDDDAEKLDALGLYLEKYPPPGFADRYSADGWRHIARGVLSAAGIFFAEPSPSPGTDFDPVRDGFRW